MIGRLTATVGTVPPNTAFTGTATTDTANDTVLIYSGSNDVGLIYTQAKCSIVDSPQWIYIAGVSPYLARVVGSYQLANNSWAITLDRSFPGVSALPIAYIDPQGPAWYSLTNDGGANGQLFDGEKGAALTPIVNGESVSPKGYQLNGQRTKLYAPVYVDATGTSIFYDYQI